MANISAGASAPDLTRARFGRVRGFAPWKPQRKTQLLLADVSEVLEEYRAFLPLTCRQVFYRLVGLKGFEKTEAAYSRLCEAHDMRPRHGKGLRSSSEMPEAGQSGSGWIGSKGSLPGYGWPARQAVWPPCFTGRRPRLAFLF